MTDAAWIALGGFLVLFLSTFGGVVFQMGRLGQKVDGVSVDMIGLKASVDELRDALSAAAELRARENGVVARETSIQSRDLAALTERVCRLEQRCDREHRA